LPGGGEGGRELVGRRRSHQSVSLFPQGIADEAASDLSGWKRRRLRRPEFQVCGGRSLPPGGQPVFGKHFILLKLSFPGTAKHLILKCLLVSTLFSNACGRRAGGRPQTADFALDIGKHFIIQYLCPIAARTEKPPL
jgi:hypothetical protein